MPRVRRLFRRLAGQAPRLRAPVADLVVLAGAAAVVHGLALVWAPLPWLAGGVGAMAAGVLLSPKLKRGPAE